MSGNEYVLVVEPSPGIGIVVEAPPRAEVALAAVQGPPGPPGPPGSAGAQLVTLTALADLSGHRAVVSDGAGGARVPDRSDPLDADAVIGLTVHAALAGQPVTVQVSGEVTETSWNWVPGPIWVGDAGLLTQTPPSNGWTQIFAVAIAPTTIVLTPRQAILPD